MVTGSLTSLIVWSTANLDEHTLSCNKQQIYDKATFTPINMAWYVRILLCDYYCKDHAKDMKLGPWILDQSLFYLFLWLLWFILWSSAEAGVWICIAVKHK
jgi:hypothetical protein